MIATAFFLWDRSDTYLFPMAKIEKYLTNGAEDNLHAYATVIIDKFGRPI